MGQWRIGAKNQILTAAEPHMEQNAAPDVLPEFASRPTKHNPGHLGLVKPDTEAQRRTLQFSGKSTTGKFVR